jgi:hypothetical protein
MAKRTQSAVFTSRINIRTANQACSRSSIKSLFSSPNITPPQLLPTYSYRLEIVLPTGHEIGENPAGPQIVGEPGG